LDWQIEEQSHDEGGAEPLLGWINTAFDEKWRSHAQSDVEGSDEPEIRPIGSFKNESIAERPSHRMCRYKNPLGSGRIASAEAFQLIDEGVHVSLNLHMQRTLVLVWIPASIFV
jgi:hypothetical protein